jgi:subtilisin family serine protease
MDVVLWSRSHFKCVFAALALTFLSSCGKGPTNQITQSADDTLKAQCASAAVPNRYVVKWKDGSTTVEEASSHEVFISEVAEPFADDIEFAENDFRIELPKTPTPAQPVGSLKEQAVAFAAASDWGQTITRAPAVWAKGVEGEGMIVAIVDTGAEVTHAQLAGQLLINAGEIPANQLDDDKNGYVDDVSGYDFNGSTGEVTDGAGHGTHVSGIIAADPAKGAIKGMAPKAKILPLRFMDDKGGGFVSDAILAIAYAKSRGAKIVNASWGGSDCSKLLKAAIADLGQNGILFVAAAGNGDAYGNAQNLDVNPEYPAAYGLENEITVGASSSRDIMAGFSNYSRSFVNLMAPGIGILSTYPGNQTRTMDGTSMATPFVSGAAALIWSAHPNASLKQVRAALFAGVDISDYPVSTGGRLNVEKALAALDAATH